MSTVDIIRTNIRRLLKEQKITQASLSNELGVQDNYISFILNGKKGEEMKIPFAEKIAVALNVPLTTLITPYSETISESEENTIPTNSLKVDFYDVKASAGYGKLTYEEQKSYMPVSKAFLARLGYDAKDLNILQVAGDSMEPTLKDGDFVFVLDHKISMPFVPRIYVIRDGGGLKIKRLDNDKYGNLIVKSDNSKYEAITYTKEEIENGLLTILGAVVGRMTTA